VFKSQAARRGQAVCEYRSAQPVTLWPLELTQAEYFVGAAGVSSTLPQVRRTRAGLRLRLKVAAGLTLDQLALDRLPLFLRGGDATPARLYEQLLAHTLLVVAQAPGSPPPWFQALDRVRPQPLGFAEDQALLPYTRRSFDGYRLLAEYFSFPQRFLFVELAGLAPACRRGGGELELLILFDRHDPALENRVDTGTVALHCTPAVNLFPKRCDRIHLGGQAQELHLVPDRTRPLDFEVHGITEVVGFGGGSAGERPFQPFYAADALAATRPEQAYFTLQRYPRVLSTRERRDGARASYLGSEVFLSLVDVAEAPYSADLRQLGVRVLATNRDLPLLMPVGQGATDFTLETAAPVRAVRCLAGPTPPRPAPLTAETTWRLISHLSLNYLSITDSDPDQGAAALRELLSLYAHLAEPAQRRQIEGVRRVTAQPVVRRLPMPGPIAFGRGLEVVLDLDEGAFEGSGVFLLGAVLEQFLARHVSVNGFTETAVRISERQEVMRWPARIGRRRTL
jgi:type VI secretion system protein ImpG